MKPLVNITVTTKNAEPYIRESIKSVKKQTYDKIAYIMIDSNSTDLTREIAKAEGVKYIIKKDTNPSEGWNLGFNTIDSKYFIPWHQDDIMIPNTRIEEQVKIMEENKEYGLIYSNYEAIDKDGNFIHKVTANQAKNLKYHSLGAHPTFMFRSKAFKEVNGYREDILFAEDWDVSFKIHKGTDWKIHKEDTVWAKVRKHSDTETQKLPKRKKLIDTHKRLKGWLDKGLIDEGEEIGIKVD